MNKLIKLATIAVGLSTITDTALAQETTPPASQDIAIQEVKEGIQKIIDDNKDESLTAVLDGDVISGMSESKDKTLAAVLDEDVISGMSESKN